MADENILNQTNDIQVFGGTSGSEEGIVAQRLKTIADSLTVGGGVLTDAQLRATPVPVSGTVTASGPLTNTELRATAVPVSGPLTDTQLRATPVPVSGTVTANSTSQTDIFAISKGLVAQHSIERVTGYNPDVDTGTNETIWNGGGIFTPPTTAGTLSIVCISPNDTSVGTGARTLKISGLDSSYNVLEETISLNGIVPVVTSGSFIAVNKATVETVGSGGSNAGLINCTRDATTMFSLPAGYNHTQLGFYTVPAGKTCYIYSWNTGQENNNSISMRTFLYIRRGVSGVIRMESTIAGNSGGSQASREFLGSINVPEKSFIRHDAICGGVNNILSSSMILILVG